MEFDRDPIEDLESQADEAWEGEAELREEEEGDWPGNENWVPDGYQEILVPSMLTHHCELFVAVVKGLLGTLLQPCDRVTRLVAEDLDWAKELVVNVSEVLAMCWSAARTDGYPEGHPDALKQASKHLEWSITKGVVSWEELTNAYWLSVLHSNPSTGDSPEDKLYWGQRRTLGERQNREAPISSDSVTTVGTEGFWYQNLEQEVTVFQWNRLLPTWCPGDAEELDDTFGLDASMVTWREAWVKRKFGSLLEFIKAVRKAAMAGAVRVPTTKGRVSDVRVNDFMKKEDPRRLMFQWKFVETRSGKKFWSGFRDTSKALFRAVQDMAESTPRRVGRTDLVVKLGLNEVRVHVPFNALAPATFALPVGELARIQFGALTRNGELVDPVHGFVIQVATELATDELVRRAKGGRMVKTAADLIGDWMEPKPRFSSLEELVQWARRGSTRSIAEKVNAQVRSDVQLCLQAVLGEIEPLHVAVWGRVVEEWREFLGMGTPPAGLAPVNQLPALTLSTVCRACGKTAKVLYADGKCPACHRAANPL